MATFKHILVPVDLTERSRRSIAEAVILARGSGARLTLLHVAPPFVNRETRADLRSRLSALLGPRDESLALDIEVAEGDPAREAVAFASAYAVDLIVVGARRRGALERALLESVGDTIVREAPCAVLTVGVRHDSELPAPRLRRILCAVDLTDSSRRTLELAGAAAEAAGASLTVLHVIDPWHWPDPGPMDRNALDAARRALERTADSRLSTLIDNAPGRSADAASLVLFGLIGPQIVQAAADVRADLLVLGAHSKRVFGRTYLGSTARYVIETAPCPILFGRPAPGTATRSTAAETGQLISKD